MKIETKITLIGFFTMFIVGVSDLIVVGILSPMSEVFQVTPALMGQLVTIYAIAFAILGPILTKYTSTFPDKKTLIFSLLLFIGTIFATIWTTSFTILCILRIFLAGSASLVTVKLLTIGAKSCSPTQKAKVVANIYVGFSAANVLGIPLSTLLASHFSWSISFVFIGIIASVCLVLIVIFIPFNAKETSIIHQGEYKVMSRKSIVLMLIFLFLMMTSNSILFTYIEPFILNYHSLTTLSIALFLSGLSGVIGSKLGSILAEKFGYIKSGRMIIAFYSFALIGLFIWANHILVLLGCITIWNLFHWGTNPTVQYALLQFIEGDPSQLFSYNIAVLNLGIGVGSLLGGVLFAQDMTLKLSLITAFFISLIALSLLSQLKTLKLVHK